MIRHRAAARLSGERGFSLVEVLVVMILLGILAAIALAVFLNQEDKGRDSSAKSDIANAVRLVEACNNGRDDADDFRMCDSAAELEEQSIPISSLPADEIGSGDCGAPGGSDPASPVAEVTILRAGKECFTVVSTSKSGNTFWYVKHNDDSVSRDCTTRGVGGCPSDGSWAG